VSSCSADVERFGSLIFGLLVLNLLFLLPKLGKPRGVEVLVTHEFLAELIGHGKTKFLEGHDVLALFFFSELVVVLVFVLLDIAEDERRVLALEERVVGS